MVAITSPPRPRIVHLENTLNQFSLLGIAFICGFACASAYDKVPELWQKKAELQRVETVDVPKLKHEVVAAKVTAAKATAHAVQAEKEKQAVLEAVGAPVSDPPVPRLRP